MQKQGLNLLLLWQNWALFASLHGIGNPRGWRGTTERARHSAGSDPTNTPPPFAPTPAETSNEISSNNCDRLFKPVFDFRRKNPSNFIFAHVNVNSIRHKFSSLREILSKNCLDYFAVSETKLDGSFPNAQFSVRGFNLLREDNTDSSGGLMVYIRSDIPHRRLTAVEYNKEGIESICVEVILGNTKTVIACIYKHPRVKNDVLKLHLVPYLIIYFETALTSFLLATWTVTPIRTVS